MKRFPRRDAVLFRLGSPEYSFAHECVMNEMGLPTRSYYTDILVVERREEFSDMLGKADITFALGPPLLEEPPLCTYFLTSVTGGVVLDEEITKRRS